MCHNWSYVRSKTKYKPGIPELQKSMENPNIMTTSDKEKADTLVEYFQSVFTQEPPGDTPPVAHRNYDQPVHINITPEIVRKKLQKLNISKSPGPDALHPRILNELSHTICTPLSIIYNQSIVSGTLPSQWKTANITAIHKKGNKSLASNYRPISLTCIVCKILESIIRDAVMKHMIKNNLLSNKQYGFISGRSTVLQLLHVLDTWMDILDSGGMVDVIYCDFMRAFDTVPHKRLIHKLETYGVTGNLLNWIHSFLTGRKQRVCVGGTFSMWTDVISGIPQGSVLGPLLFVLFINDLPETIQNNTDIYLFADDTKIFRAIYNDDDCQKLQEDLDSLYSWTNDSLLKFHPQKCKHMRISLHQSVPSPYHIGPEKHPVTYTSSEKDIGVIFDERLTFEQHLNEKINKANSIVGIIRRTFEYLDTSNFMQLYKSLVRPHIEYANQIWTPYLKKHITALENVQRRATKLIPSLKDLSYPERLRALNLPTLAYRRRRGDMIELYKILTPTYDPAVTTGFIQLSGDHITRGHSLKIKKIRPRLKLRQCSFPLRCTDHWNNLPTSVVEAISVASFERRLDKHWNNLPLKLHYLDDTTAARAHNVTLSDTDPDLTVEA